MVQAQSCQTLNCRKCDRAGCQAAMWIQYGLAGTECRWVWRIYPPAWGGGLGGGAHSSPALSHIKVKHVEHVDVTICEIFTRVFGTNVGA
jgi:hypothetical protein